jgi:hypothetical protein
MAHIIMAHILATIRNIGETETIVERYELAIESGGATYYGRGIRIPDGAVLHDETGRVEIGRPGSEPKCRTSHSQFLPVVASRGWLRFDFTNVTHAQLKTPGAKLDFGGSRCKGQ